MKKLLTILLIMVSFAGNSQTTVDTTIDGYNASIWRPARYYESGGNVDSTISCIVFSYGAGETGASYATMKSIGGPLAYIFTGGFNGKVVMPSGDTLTPIVIGLRIPTAFPTSGQPLAKLDVIRAAFKIKKENLHVGGFSAGGYAYKIMATEDNYDATEPYGPFTYAGAFKSIVDVQGVLPDDNADWYIKVKNFARNGINGGGRYFGIWGTADGDRQIPRFKDSMNAAVANSGIVHTTSDGHSWNAVHKVWGNPNGTAPQTWNMNGRTLTAWQWVLLQSKDTVQSSADENLPPSVSVRSDTTMLFITDQITLTGSASDVDGSVTSHTWTKVSGPSCTITSPSNYTTTVTGMTRGTYVFRLTATDDDDSTAYSQVNVYNGIPCNEAAPVTYTIAPTSPGEIYITNASTRGWKGGDTLLIPAGTYSVIEIDTFGGDPCRPITIRNVGGQVVVTGPMRFKSDVHYVQILGKDSAGINYGFKCQSFAFDRVMNFTMSRIEIGPNPSGTGITGKQNPDSTKSATLYPNYISQKILIEYCYVHDVAGEGMYIGNTAPNADPYYGYKIPQRNDSVTIRYNIVRNTGWDAIQLSNARNGALIYGNTVDSFGLLNGDGQRAGIILGGNTNGKVYDNVITNGYGNGLQFFGYGVLEGYNNTITNVGLTNSHANGEQSFFSNNYVNSVETNPLQTIHLYNNYFTQIRARGAIQVQNDNAWLDTTILENNKFCFAVDPGVDWKDDYLIITGGYTDTNNQKYCTPVNTKFRITRRFKF